VQTEVRERETALKSEGQIIMEKPIAIETYVKQYYADDPILAQIAKCESGFRQFDKSGKILRGDKNSDDVGVMQINEIYHLERSKKLGFDIKSIDGNLAYAKWLYDKEGAAPWNASSKCWSKTSANIELADSK
jgi:hypothetical protein